MQRLAYIETIEDGWYDGKGKAVPVPVIHAMRALFERLEERGLPCPRQSPIADVNPGISALWVGNNLRRVMLYVQGGEASFEVWLCSFAVDKPGPHVDVTFPHMNFDAICKQVAWCQE